MAVAPTVGGGKNAPSGAGNARAGIAQSLAKTIAGGR